MIILTTGKGGVGKTTLSAATALGLSRAGHRTAVVSVDPAHSLGDVLDRRLGPEPTTVSPNLDALEVGLAAALHDHWGTIQGYLSRLFQSQGVDDWLAEDVAYLPGLEEVAGLLELRRLNERYDRVVVDCPPTGSTLRFLNLPEAVQWYMEKFFPFEKRLVQAVGPLAEKLVGVPMPDGDVMNQVEGLFGELLELRVLLTDPARAVAQVATTGESVVCRETERAIGYLHLHHIAVARVLVNRTMPARAAEVATRVAPIPAAAVPAQDVEPVGLGALLALSEALFDGADPTPTARPATALTVEGDGAGAILVLHVPRPEGVDQGLKVGRRGDDVVIDYGPVRRHLPLPPAVARQRLSRAHWTAAGIRLEFTP